MASTEYHEPIELLSAETIDMHRALVSAIEELEAIDWYQQRADASVDADLVKILLHNKNEEIEHFSMTLEWIRRRNPAFSERMKKYLFSEGEITELERGSKSSKPSSVPDGSLAIGGLKE
jgi:ferritin-like protein